MSNHLKLPTHTGMLLNLLHAGSAAQNCLPMRALSPADWEVLIRAAIDYRLAYRFRQALEADVALKADVPEALWGLLDGALRQNREINIRRILQLRHLATACDAEGIPFLLMKGLWLVEVAYRDTSARGSGDIDVLVQPRDMPRFTALISRLGFTVPSGVQDLRELAPENNEFALRHRRLGTTLDIHWAMTHPGKEAPVDEASFWSRAEHYSIAGHPLACLGLEDHLLLLCFHAVIHHRCNSVGPRVLLDVAQVIAHPPRDIDWADLISRAQGLGWERAAWLMLELVRRHVGVQPPSFVMEALRSMEAPPPDVLSAAVEALFLDQFHVERFDSAMVAVLTEWNLWQFIGNVLSRLFAPREYVASYFGVKANEGISPWLIFKRWRNIFQQKFPIFLQWLRSDPALVAELQRSKLLLTWLNAERDFHSQNQNAESTRW